MYGEGDHGDLTVTHVIGGLAIVLALTGKVCGRNVVFGPSGQNRGALRRVFLVPPPAVLGHRPSGR